MYKKMRLFLLVPALISVLLLSACTNSVEFTINFDSNGGSEVSSIKTDGTSSITLPNDPIKDGYSFAGWYWDNSTFRDLFTVNSLLERGISGNLTVYAKWNKEDTPIGAIKVTFNSMGGSEVNPQYVQKDNTIAIPNTSKVGYTLDGWYTSLNNGQTFDEKWSFTNNKVTTDITLYAKWIINQYTITFNSNGGSSVSSITQDYDTVVIVPANPTKLGYTFLGWSQPVPIKMPAEDVTLIAEWSINQYTITFNSNGGSPVTAITQDWATTVSKPTDPTKVGYTFAGWYINSSLTTAYTFTTMPAEDITLYAKWNIITYKINYELADGLNHLSNPSSYTIETNTIILSAPIKEGYTFEGWYSDSNFTNYVSEITIGSIGNLTLYAKWTLNSYTLSYDSNGGSPVTAITQDYATTVSKPTDPTKVGYTFAGWYINSSLTTPYTFTTMPAQNITLYAKWVPLAYNINYELADGLNHLSNPSSYTIETNTIILSAPIKEGYTFEGWYSDSNFTNYVSEITIGSIGNLTLYAKWQNTITFNTNGGSLVESITQDYGTTVIQPNDPTREGYTFGGWFSDSGLAAAYTFSSMPAQNITLYAKWQNTITFNTNGGSLVEPITQDTLTTVAEPTDPSKEGYTFGGWYINSSLTTPYTFTTMPAQNITLYAKWQLITYSITYVMNENTTNDASNPATYNVTSNISLIAPSVIEGTFIGWFTDEDYTNEIENISNMMGNITLYAKVEMNQYTMTFVTNGGTEISPITQDYDTAIHVSTTKEGYMFEAWCSDEGLTTSIDISKMPNANLTVYAKWAQMYEYFTIDNMTYVYYGTYPQTVVDDSSLISSLNSLTSTNANGYYEFEGEEYAKVDAHPSGNDYEFKNGYKFKNGSTIQSGQTYYFKVEPIKWRVLEEADGTYTLLSEYIIDKQVFYISRDNRTIGDQTIYANNYEHSTIREWLNNAFYNKAFSSPEKGSILTTLVDNSASTTVSSTNPYFSNNTMDKVYLLSYQEARSSTYGFSTSAYSSPTRIAVTTDYARAVGAYMDTSTSYYGNGSWLLRSPNIMYNISHFAHIVQRGGYINNSNVYDSFYGARPAIKIG